MLLRRGILERIAKGEVTLAFRCWRRPTVKPGGTLRTAVGILAVHAVDPVQIGDISDTDVAAAGYISRDELLADLRADGTLYRITLHLVGEDPRASLRDNDQIDSPARDAIRARLHRLDREGPWTSAALALIADAECSTAAEIAAKLTLDKATVKRRIRHLKELGLTESLSSGYRLSPRGRAWLALRG